MKIHPQIEMINKSIQVIMFMICINGGILIVQYTIADVYGMELVNHEGISYKSKIIDSLGTSQINSISDDILNQGDAGGDGLDGMVDSAVDAAHIVWELVTLLSGTYVFYILVHFGVPEFVVGIMMIPYTILLVRTVVGLVRGV